MPKELRDLKITKIALVRKGYRPVNDGARITVVKAEEDKVDLQAYPAGAESSGALAERFVKAMKAFFAGDSDAGAEQSAPIAKAKMATHLIADDGSHGRMSGIHSHEHSHSDGKGGVYTHTHEHSHSDDAFHYHDDNPAHASVMKAHDADAAIDAKVTKLIGQMEEVLAQLKAAQEKDNEISKAIPTTEALEKLVDTRITAALEPVVKAIEDLGIAHARLPRTLNPTVSLAPTQTDGAKERAAAVKTMSFGEALRYLVAN